MILNVFLFTQDGEEEEFKDLAEENDDKDDDEEERFVDADKLEEGASAEAQEVKFGDKAPENPPLSI